MTIVNGYGRKPNTVLLCGEAPGREEAARGIPFVGASGREQETYLGRHGLTARHWYRTNVVKLYQEGNPDPTPALIRKWTPVLEQEIDEVSPLLVVAVGRFAARWFLGDSVEMETVHGIPHPAGAFDGSRRGRAGVATVLPIYHPAMGLHDKEGDSRVLIDWDYTQVAETLRRIQNGQDLEYLTDPYEGHEQYADVNGALLRGILASIGPNDPISLDTEGVPSNPWSVQISFAPGVGYCLRRSRSDFAEGIAAIQAHADGGATVVLHNGMYDVEMSRALGLELSRANLFDTMYAAYLLRREPQGLKHLAYRWTGMRMVSYEETVGDVGRDKQVDYIGRILERKWPKPEPRVIQENDGTCRLYKPRPIETQAEKILIDVYGDPPADPYKRWHDQDLELRRMVEKELGPMPIGTLDDIPLDRAVHYSCRDADATIRLYNCLQPELRRMKLSSLMENGMEVLPIFEEMQYNGMPASRSYFEKLHAEMSREMGKIQGQISHRYYGGKPFNPASPSQVGAIMRRRGLRGAKKTKTGAMSTGKKSIEHLRADDPAIDLIITWREHQKVRDAFCQPVMDRLDPDLGDVQPMRANIKTTRVHTRRLAASNPNLLGIPVRTDLGRKVREGYIAPEGEMFGAWDLSQVEMRYMAHLSQDKRLVKAFVENRDIHSETAALIFGIPVEQVDEMRHRYPAKRVAFGVITSITGAGLFDQLRVAGCAEGWDVDRCDKMIVEWFNIYSGVRDYMEVCKREARVKGMVRDEWGMIRYLPGVYAADKMVRLGAERASSSHKISGGAQGMIQNSMRWLKPIIRDFQGQGFDVHWQLQIHDEVILRADESLMPILDPIVTEALTEHHGVKNIRVPIKAKGHFAKTWGGLK